MRNGEDAAGDELTPQGDQQPQIGADLEGWVLRYVSGECTAEQAAELQRRLASNPGLARQVEALQEVWDATGRTPRPRKVDRAWRSLRSKLHDEAVARPFAPPESSRFVADFTRFQSRSRVGLIAAAAAVVVAIAGRLFLRPNHSGADESVTAPAPEREYSALAGERAELRLPDGTRVMLGAASRLRVPAGYGRSSRDVGLDGQAYFDVVHDSLRPFRVRTAQGVVEDLGTEFVVTTYPESGGTRVVVVSGVVGLATTASERRPLLLQRGDLGRLDSAGVAHVKHDVDVEAELDWTRGQLTFRRTPLRQVLLRLERWYGVRIHLAAITLGGIPVSATFGGEGPAQALEFVAAAVGARVSRPSSDDAAYTLHLR